MPYYQGDLLLAEIAFSDLSGTKKRPVLIVSKNSMNQGEDFLVAKVTSNIKAHKSAVYIDNNAVDFSLNRSSEIRCGEIMTLHNSLITKKLGKVNDNVLKAVLKQVRENFIQD